MDDKFRQVLKSGSDFELWMAVAQAALDLRYSSGIDSLTCIQRLATSTWVASGMIGNRGFFDHSIEEMTEWAKAYDGLGIGAAADAIREAALLMPAINWDNNDPVEQQLDPIEKRFYEADEQTPGAIAALIRKSPEVAFAALQ